MTKSKIKFLILICFLFTLGTVHAQGPKLINYTEFGALVDLSNSAGSGNKINGIRSRTGISRIIKEHFGLGIALGADNYREANGGNYNTFPFSINGSWYVKPDFTGLKADIYGGYSFNLFNNYNKGLMGGVGLAYGFDMGPKTMLSLQTGFNYQEIAYRSSFLGNSFSIQSIRIGAGLTFK